jgi:hypothetical protein
MANSRRYRQLLSQLHQLRKNYLPRNWDPTGNYSPRKYHLILAYRLFAHAEIESFLEDIILELVEKKFDTWKRTKKPNYIMICILAASKCGWQDIETNEMSLRTIEPPKIKKDDNSITDWIERAVYQFKDEIIKKNHGIQMSDIKRLIMPLGISMADLDQTWLTSMQSFGGQRGFVAHTSRLGIRTLPDPKTELETVEKHLIPGIKILDEKIFKIDKET